MTFKRLYIAMGLITVFLYFVFYLNQMPYVYVLIIISLEVLLFAVGSRILFVRFFAQINSILDQMLKGGALSEKELTYLDDLFSKMIHKLWKINRLYLSDRHSVIDEKKKIQSLISDIAHQVKTPMTNIRMYHEIMSDKIAEDSEITEMMEIVCSQVDKLDFLMKSLLRMSELESGMIVLDKKDMQVRDCVARSVEGIILYADRKNIEINVHEGMALKIFCDLKWTSEALFNILDNAVKYTDEGGRIDIKAEKMQIYTRVCISDTGIGIMKENLTNIYKRFFKEESSQCYDGVGIGLSLARDIVMKQEGYISVDSEKGQGSNFYIYIPETNFDRSI